MIGVVSFLLILAVSLLVIRIGAVALVMTGLSEDVARFQALSAFSAAGFTTAEAESVVGTPVRRRIISLLIWLGSAGIVSAISTLMLSFVEVEGARFERMMVLVAGVILLVLLARSQAFSRLLTSVIKRALGRYTSLDVRDYASLLRLRGDYRIAEIDVEPGSWLASRCLGDLDLAAEGVIVLGVTRGDGTYVGAPGTDLHLVPGDQLIVYGRSHRLIELAERDMTDEAAHQHAREEHIRDLSRQEDRA
ncbi:hypothetical protein AWN76_002675 [Rhodothermaceae bacterium RA]|nr:hypothetical protein AWN76_002675 [Rhodothermaceae bacterium RA]